MSQNRGNRRRGGFGFGPPRTVEKAKDFRGTLKRMIASLGRYRSGLFIVIVLAILSTVFSVIGPRVMGNATDELVSGFMAKMRGVGGINFSRIGSILLTLLGLYLISAVLSFVQGWIMTGISQRTAFRFRKEITEKIHRMPMAYFESNTTGDVLSRITNDVDTLGMSLHQSVSQLITSFSTLLGALVMMLSISLPLTLVAFAMLPLTAALVGFVMKRSQKYFVQQQESLGQINGQVEEIYGGHIVVKAFGREEIALKEFNETNRMLYQSAWKSQFISGIMMPVMGFISNLGYVAVAIVGGIQIINGHITIGNMQSFFQYIRMFTQPISQMAQVMNMVQSMCAAAERVFAFLDEEEEVQTAANPVDPDGIQGSVSFEHVRFGYTDENIVIGDFNARVDPGMTVAIVGPTGAGKTTMVKLLMRFYDVTSGRITLDGHDIRSFDRTALRSLFGMVLQDTWLFKGSILENIRYGRPEATDSEVIAAARTAHVHHFIQTMPGGYQMELNEEATNVSQGQKQLLTIARAILANKKLLILDEATSSVDTSTESRIQRGMHNLMKGRTNFVIAHRLSTIRDADLILVMRDGDIAEQGTHDALIERDGFYAELYRAQFEDVGA
ncbi:MAG: ABC transporter ATP-binding protein/permease [Clostridia bacterium]|nr:ABC transporter ATP-binding protein/permease [Clostridia bacterium]